MPILLIAVVLLCWWVAPASAGWVVQRADGTYRSWSCCAKDETLRAGETYVKMDTMPTIGPDAATLSATPAVSIGDRIDAAKTVDDLKVILKERLK